MNIELLHLKTTLLIEVTVNFFKASILKLKRLTQSALLRGDTMNKLLVALMTTVFSFGVMAQEPNLPMPQQEIAKKVEFVLDKNLDLQQELVEEEIFAQIDEDIEMEIEDTIEDTVEEIELAK